MSFSQAYPVFNSLQNDKILDWPNLKAFADDKINVTKGLKFVLGREENNVGKGENAGYQHFLLFLRCFQKVLKVGIVQERVNFDMYCRLNARLPCLMILGALTRTHLNFKKVFPELVLD